MKRPKHELILAMHLYRGLMSTGMDIVNNMSEPILLRLPHPRLMPPPDPKGIYKATLDRIVREEKVWANKERNKKHGLSPKRATAHGRFFPSCRGSRR